MRNNDVKWPSVSVDIISAPDYRSNLTVDMVRSLCIERMFVILSTSQITHNIFTMLLHVVLWLVRNNIVITFLYGPWFCIMLQNCFINVLLKLFTPFSKHFLNVVGIFLTNVLQKTFLEYFYFIKCFTQMFYSNVF